MKILRIHCQNSAVIMTNGIRKVRQGLDIFNKRILNSCKFILVGTSEYGLVCSNFFHPSSRVKTSIIVHGAQPIRILLSMFPFSLFPTRGKWKRSIEKHLLLFTIIFFFSKYGVIWHVLINSTQGSAQRQETRWVV